MPPSRRRPPPGVRAPADSRARAGDEGARRGPGRPRGRQRAAHSLEAILQAAVELLDEAGESALTFRALAARLGGGVGSVYWYVSNKDELLDRATDLVMGGVLAQTEVLAGDDPIATLRDLALALFAAMEAHPWLAAYLLRDVGMQPNSIRLYERFGQELLRLDLTRRQRFHAVSAIVNYVVGVGAEMGHAPDRVEVDADGAIDREAYLAAAVQEWRELDETEFPFVHEVAAEFEQHEDREQFVAGLDLMLAGLRLQTKR